MPQPTATTRLPRPQRPAFEGLFREPVYADGPYDQGDEEDDLEETSG